MVYPFMILYYINTYTNYNYKCITKMFLLFLSLKKYKFILFLIICKID